MKIRLAKKEDLREVRGLWEYCFNDSKKFVDWFFSSRYDPENTLVLDDNGHICSALQLLPYEISLRKQVLKTSYLVGVSTWPEDRGKGYANKLLRASLETMRNHKQWVSILLPFNYGFYRKYGWETCYQHLVHIGRPENFSSKTGNVEGSLCPINLKADIETLIECYSFITQCCNGFIKRTNDDWMRVLTDLYLDGGHGYIYRGKNGENGYILYIIEKNLMTIREIGYSTPEAKKGIFRFVANHNGHVEKVIWKAPGNDETFIKNMGDGIKLIHKPFVMGRIVDVQKALQGLKTSQEIDIVIEVIDQLLPWNNSRFILRSDSGVLSVYPWDGPPDFILSIRTLAQLLWGFSKPRNPQSIETIYIVPKHKYDMLYSLFYDTTPYIYEDY